MTETMMDKVLKLLYKESPLSPKIIGEKLGIKPTSVRPILSMASSLGVVENYKEIRGLFVLTNYGRKIVEEKQNEVL